MARMMWAEFVVSEETTFIEAVQGLWEVTYWPIHSRKDTDTVRGAYQIVKFIDDPEYYVRMCDVNPVYDRSGCLPQSLSTLTKAKRAVEMLNCMQCVIR